MVEILKDNNNIYAILIKYSFKQDGISFFTPDSFSQQMGYMSRPKGYLVPPHIHKLVQREVYFTQEVIFLRSGRAKVSVYLEDCTLLKEYELEKNDFILLARGGHSILMLEDSEIIEIKQGPYLSPNEDKIIFSPALPIEKESTLL